jgi:hypothetical protein
MVCSQQIWTSYSGGEVLVWLEATITSVDVVGSLSDQSGNPGGVFRI